MKNKVGLVILDGWGLAIDKSRSAIDMAQTPFINSLNQYPHSTLTTFGEEVGLPDGQMGNSEVGHLNIGAGRVVYQDLALINKAIRQDTLKSNPALKDMITYAEAHDKPVHLMGLLSDGGVHSHIQHLFALVNILLDSKVNKVYIHAFLDGRDTDPHSGKGYLADLQAHIDGTKCSIASVIGRYYAMDRDHRWERVELAYDMLVHGKAVQVDDLDSYISQCYTDGTTDEFILPAKVEPTKGNIEEGDAVLFFNYRTDRPRQLTTVLTQNPIEGYAMQPIPNLHYVTLTQYDASYTGLHIMYTKDNLVNTLGQVLESNNKRQLRLAETEKYPHVTFFFNGGRELPFEGEERIMVNSPKVATYDLQPEMSAYELTDALVNRLENGEPLDFFCLNYANTDMVGHTGVVSAAIKAAQAVDACMQRLVTSALEQDFELIVIADHGNSDIIINEDGSPNTAHTTNLVPIWYVSKSPKSQTISAGKLGDVAVTILNLMQIDLPKEMDGENLIV